LMMEARTFGSIPNLVPSNMDSETAVMVVAKSKLFAILATCPIPEAPQWTMFFPMYCKTSSFARWKAFSVPPHMNVKVPAAAPPVPPETGASILKYFNFLQVTFHKVFLRLIC
jgi:hypothetical protein